MEITPCSPRSPLSKTDRLMAISVVAESELNNLRSTIEHVLRYGKVGKQSKRKLKEALRDNAKALEFIRKEQERARR